MTAPAPYVSVYRLLRDWARPAIGLTIVRLDERTGLPPPNLPSIVPVATMARVGGSRTIPFDLARVVIDVYAGDLDSAEVWAEKLATALQYQLPGYRMPDGSAWVKEVTVTSTPSPAAYDSSIIGRMTATYEITVRSRFTRPT